MPSNGRLIRIRNCLQILDKETIKPSQTTNRIREDTPKQDSILAIPVMERFENLLDLYTC
jgi:hypothetical protein